MSIAAVLMLFVIAPAAATDVSVSWSDNSNLNTVKVVQPSDVSSLVYTITSPSTDLIEFVLTIENPDIYDVGYGIIFPTDFIGQESDPQAVIQSAVFQPATASDKGILTIIIEPRASFFDLTVAVTATAARTYNDEVAIINASITQSGQQENADSASIRVVHQGRTGSMAQVLSNPSRFPTADSETDIFLTLSHNTPQGSVGSALTAASLTYNFSGITLYADGIGPITLSQWKAAHGYDILTFESSSNATFNVAIDNENFTATYTRVDGIPITLVTSGQALPLNLKMNENFTNTVANPTAPYIIFTNVTLSAENLRTNSRGPAITNIISGANPAGPDSGNAYGFGRSGTRFDAIRAGEQNLRISFLGPVSTGAMDRQIINSSEGIFEYQNLFKVNITNNIRDGSTETIDFSIPDGLTVTHIRVPSLSNDQTSYSGIEIYVPKNDSWVNLASARTHNLTEFGYTEGEDITLIIHDVVRMLPSPSAAYSDSATHMITFIGQVNTTKGLGSFTFGASLNGTGESVSSDLTITVRDSYTVMPYIWGGVVTSSNTGYTAVPTLVGRGDTFYMFTNYSGSAYPYHSVLRFDPMNVDATTAVSNPVIYFSVPAGLIPGVPEVTLANGMVTTKREFNFANPSAAQDLVISTRVFENEGLYGADGGSVVEVKFDLENNPLGETFWTRGGIVRLPVTVSDDFEGTSFAFSRQSVLVSTWDPNAFEVAIGGAGGDRFLLSNFFSAGNLSSIAASVNGATSRAGMSLSTQQVQVASAASVSANVGVWVSPNYVSYRQGSVSYPILHAGSQNEEFRMSFSNRLDGVDVESASIYFVLPFNDEWSPVLVAPGSSATDLNIAVSGDLQRENITVYYTTQSLSNTETLTSIENAAWTEITSSNLLTLEWADVTALRADVENVSGSSGFNLFLNFNLPNIRVADLNSADTIAIGQTLYTIEVDDSRIGTIFSETGPTGAIRLRESLPPQIVSNSGAVFASNTPVEYRLGSVPAALSGGFIVRDDFSDVKINEIVIRHTPPGSIAATEVYRFVPSNLSNAVTSVPYSETIDSQTFIGYTYTFVPSLRTYMEGLNQTLGVHSVTLISEQDNDLNRATVTYTITVAKDETKVTLTQNSYPTQFLMDAASTLPLLLPNGTATPSGSTWTTYMT
ncbi:MAG: hypothetical protein LBE57_03905, partial [Methanosarcinales archaeon]|nr:hypothetical protein [Methanosarcinales archaeon]